jgi:hypothetical protein
MAYTTAVDGAKQEITMVKTDVRIVSYYSQTHLDIIKKYGFEIGSSTMSNTVRSIVVPFLNNHFGKTAVKD